MIIIGIDPGTANLGFGVIKRKKGGSLECLNYGTIKTEPSDSPGERLRELNNRLSKLIKKYRVDVLAVEKLFFFKNLKTAIPVSQAKGVVLLTAAKNRIPALEFAPLKVKLAVVGYGRAEKKKMQKKIKKILNLKEVPKPDDAADALGVAVCCIQEMEKK